MTKANKTVKEEIVELYNKINDTESTADEISFRVNGVFKTVTELSDEEAQRILEFLKAQLEK